MSKLMIMYNNLKTKEPNTLFLFRSGIFYLALDKDATYLSQLLGLKLTPLNNDTLKCGFPCASLDKYLALLKNFNLEIKIIEVEKSKAFPLKAYEQERAVLELLEFIKQLNIDNLSIPEAYQTLEKLQQKALKIGNNN